MFGLPQWLGFPIVRLVHYVMQRKQLLGIANRVEHQNPASEVQARPVVVVR